MTMTIPLDDAVLRRSAAGQEAAERLLESLLIPIVTVCACLLVIIGAGFAEFFSATVGFGAAFPTLSDGTSLADTIMPMRYAIAAYMILGHIVLRGITDHFGVSIKWLFNAIGLAALLLMLASMAAFMFSATFQTTGGSDDQGWLSGMAGPALGCLCASMFTVSFLAAHAAAGTLLRTVPALIERWRAHRRVAGHAQALKAVEGTQARIVAREAIIAEMSKPDALAKRAAVEAAREAGLAMAKAHELRTERTLYGDAALADEDDAPLRDVPQAALDQRFNDLAKYDFAHFFNMLKKDGDHA